MLLDLTVGGVFKPCRSIQFAGTHGLHVDERTGVRFVQRISSPRTGARRRVVLWQVSPCVKPLIKIADQNRGSTQGSADRQVVEATRSGSRTLGAVQPCLLLLQALDHFDFGALLKLIVLLGGDDLHIDSATSLGRRRRLSRVLAPAKGDQDNDN